MIKSLIFLSLLFSALSWETYDSHIVVRVEVENHSQYKWLHSLQDSNQTFSFWKDPTPLGFSDIMMHAEVYPSFKVELDQRGLKNSIWIEDVGSLIRNQMVVKDPSAAAEFFEAYHPYVEIEAFIIDLAAQYPDLVKLEVLGRSYLGKPIYLLRLQGQNPSGDKPGLFFHGGIHAREWISPATSLYIINQLVTNYWDDAEVQALVDGLNIYYIPVFNVDGYEYTWTSDRLWRKTRKPNTGSNCAGTDPNRNWNFHWREAGTSTNPCSEIYCGPSAASEPEVKLISDFVANQNNNIKGYIDFHSYSQVWLGPWGYTTAVPRDLAVQNAISARVVDAIYQSYGTTYIYGPSSTTLYATSGSSVDFAYNAGIIYAFTIELRDTGRFGFTLPPEQIVPSGIETYDGWLVFANHILETYGKQ